jgi:hypothetical protein
MHVELSSFLTTVWENREVVMWGQPDPTGQTVEDRIYAIYAPVFDGKTRTPLARQQYDASIRALPGRIATIPNSGWQLFRNDWASVWTNSRASQTVAERIYLNAKLDHAADIFVRIIAMSVAAPPPPAVAPPPPQIGRPLPTPPQPVVPDHVLRSGYAALANRGRYGDVVSGAKIAWTDAAFGGRPDKIVVYVNTDGGRSLASSLARRIAAFGPFFENDHVPMTERIDAGISLGAEVSGQQWQIATSFGEVRCNLIARALVQAVTGQVTPDFATNVPVTARSLPSPDRLRFVQLVEQLFTANGIDPNNPWA